MDRASAEALLADDEYCQRAWLRIVHATTVTEAGCWERAQTTKQGYTYTYFGTGSMRTYTVAFLLTHGPFDPDKELDHLCRNRRCHNPLHLDPKTRGENLRASPLVSPVLWGSTHFNCGHPRTPENTGTFTRKRDNKVNTRCATCHRDRERNRRVCETGASG